MRGPRLMALARRRRDFQNTALFLFTALSSLLLTTYITAAIETVPREPLQKFSLDNFNPTEFWRTFRFTKSDAVYIASVLYPVADYPDGKVRTPQRGNSATYNGYAMKRTTAFCLYLYRMASPETLLKAARNFGGISESHMSEMSNQVLSHTAHGP